MICKECGHNKPFERFHQYEPGRYRKTCKSCRSALERDRVRTEKRDLFRRLTSWPAV